MNTGRKVHDFQETLADIESRASDIRDVAGKIECRLPLSAGTSESYIKSITKWIAENQENLNRLSSSLTPISEECISILGSFPMNA